MAFEDVPVLDTLLPAHEVIFVRKALHLVETLPESGFLIITFPMVKPASVLGFSLHGAYSTFSTRSEKVSSHDSCLVPGKIEEAGARVTEEGPLGT